MSFEELLKIEFKEISVDLNEVQVKQFKQYYEMLIEANQKFNLTAITEMQEVIVKHFVDSCLLLEDVELKGSLIDVGTGAGFPGIPLKIINRHLQVTLLDSLRKRIVFLEDVCQKLGLNDVKCVHETADNSAKMALYRDNFDICVSRAVAKLPTLLEYCTPFLKVGGSFYAYKSIGVEEELAQATKAMKILNCKAGQVFNHKIVCGEEVQKRTIVEFKKTALTPKAYPRPQNKPRTHPLI